MVEMKGLKMKKSKSNTERGRERGVNHMIII